jgi:hypothetical protein
MARLTFTATGDSIITRRVAVRQDAPFRDLITLIRSADVALTNLELMTTPSRGSSTRSTS